MEILLYKNTVGRFFHVVNLGDLTSASSTWGGGISQAMGGTSWLAKGGTWSDIPALPDKSRSLNNTMERETQYKAATTGTKFIQIFHENFPTYEWEFKAEACESVGSPSVGANNMGQNNTESYFWLGLAIINNVERFGFFAYNETAETWGFLYQPVSSDALNVIWDTASSQPSPGEKGFRPTGARTSKNAPGIGGRPGGPAAPGTNPGYEGDHITQPGAPDETHASAIGAGFLTCYKIDENNLAKVGADLYGETLLNIIRSISVNPLDFIVSLMVFPAPPADVKAADYVKLGGWRCKVPPVPADPENNLGIEAQGYPLAKQFRVINFGTLNVYENWGNFLDYQTQIELYLPFIGVVQIDPAECMNGTINVQYTIDYFTGMCVANVLCSKPGFELPNGQIIPNVEAQHSYQGNCAIQIPLSAINYGSMIGSLINSCTQAITNPAMGVVGAAETALNGGFSPNVTSKGNLVANSGYCSVLYPYIRLTRPITAEPDSYQETIGYPSYINTKLGECEGLCICDEINVEGITGATANEKLRIQQLCKEGVFV